jgi:hypothetical protein
MDSERRRRKTREMYGEAEPYGWERHKVVKLTAPKERDTQRSGGELNDIRWTNGFNGIRSTNPGGPTENRQKRERERERDTREVASRITSTTHDDRPKGGHSHIRWGKVHQSPHRYNDYLRSTMSLLQGYLRQALHCAAVGFVQGARRIARIGSTDRKFLKVGNR